MASPAPSAAARLQRLLAELDYVLGAAARPGPVRADQAAVPLVALCETSCMREAAGDLGRRALAILVLLVAAWILFKVVIGVVTAVATVVVVVLAIFAVIWAIRIL